ncbi:hypothetical protein [Rhizobium sp. BK602]|uniref:hypothetical protein n=1 Tax=Rhizobium sp. BK602 TaxID=2586986 RepID=UPI001AED4B2A|nr:hypothetical protein [Rhizobium sp. BK602]
MSTIPPAVVRGLRFCHASAPRLYFIFWRSLLFSRRAFYRQREIFFAWQSSGDEGKEEAPEKSGAIQGYHRPISGP